jgi:predicted dehydrogenase
MAEAINTSGQAELRWIVDANQARAQTIAEKYHAPRFALDYEQALQDPEVQVVTCFVSPDKSAGLCIAAAEAGKHIISIKPMAMNLDEADRVVAAVKRAGVKYFPGAGSFLFFGHNLAFKKWSDAGRIGKLIAASGTFHADLPRDWPDSSNPGWFIDPKRVPGGAWIDHAIYYMHVFRKWFGTEIVRAEGAIDNLKYPSLAVEDYGQAIFTFANGATATIASTWLGAPGAPRQSLEFFGSEGTLVWDSLLNKVAVAGKFGEELSGWIEIARPAEPVSRATSIIEHLITCIREDRTPLCTAEDDRASLAASLAFYEAARAHRAIAPRA